MGFNMPTIKDISGPYRFFFYAGDKDEPPHVHVEHENNIAKFWIDPIRLDKSGGFSRHEINQIYKLCIKNKDLILRSWNEYFND